MAPNKILIQTSNTYEVVEVNSILSLQSNQGVTKVFLDDNNVIVSNESFATLLKQLINNPIYRCHKSYAINLKKVKRYHKDGYVVLADNSEILVARRRVNELISKLISENNVLK